MVHSRLSSSMILISDRAIVQTHVDLLVQNLEG